MFRLRKVLTLLICNVLQFVFPASDFKVKEYCIKENVGCFNIPVYASSDCDCHIRTNLSGPECLRFDFKDIPLPTISFREVLNNNVSERVENLAKIVQFLLTNGDCKAIRTEEKQILSINKCPGASEDLRLKELCENSPPAPIDYIDDIYITFKNGYCALCHGVRYSNSGLGRKILSWNQNIECENKNLSSWSDIEEGLEANTCISSVSNPLRFDTMTNCLNSSVNLFRNIMEFHCQKCSAVRDLNDLNCITCGVVGRTIGEAFTCPGSTHNNGLVELFRISTVESSRIRLNGGVFKNHVICQQDEVFDVFFQKCRTIRCPVNEFPKNGKCFANTTLFISSTSQPIPNGTNVVFLLIVYTVETGSETTSSVWDLIRKIRKLKAGWLTVVPIPLGFQAYEVMGRGFIQRSLVQLEIASLSIFDVLDKLAGLKAEEDNVEVNFQVSNFEDSKFPKNGTCDCGMNRCLENVPATIVDGLLFAKVMDNDNRTLLFPIENIGFNLSVPDYMYNMACVCLPSDSCESSETCQQTKYVYEEDEYRILGNGDLEIMRTNFRLKFYEYQIDRDKKAVVCVDPTRFYDSFFTLNKVQGYLSLACSGISIVFLSITVIFYFVFRELQRLPSQIILCQAIMLIMGQTLLMFPQLGITICRYLGAISHFSWLSAFMWSSVQAYNMLYTFHPKTMRHKSSDGANNSLRNYCLVCFAAPALFVFTCFLMDVIPESPLHVGYGINVCGWLYDRIGSIATFYAPVGLILCSNLICFSATFFYIERAVQISDRVTGRKRNRYRCLIYIKLSSVMGFTWGFGFLASATELSYLWYAYVILNGLQGLFIFLSFCFTTNNRKHALTRLQSSGIFTTLFRVSTSKTPTINTVSGKEGE